MVSIFKMCNTTVNAVEAVQAASSKKIISIEKILKYVLIYMRVEGHTDNIPISTYEFASNWQLSTTSTANVTELRRSKNRSIDSSLHKLENNK